MGFPVIGIPASIDNDIPFTDMALGVDTALNNIIYAVDCIKDTASSHARAFVIEVMGRNSGYLASVSAIASGAEFALVPEREFDLADICQQLRARYEEGRDNAIIILAEGAGKGAGGRRQHQGRHRLRDQGDGARPLSAGGGAVRLRPAAREPVRQKRRGVLAGRGKGKDGRPGVPCPDRHPPG